MLSEARARLANTQGKKAKRKARERQLEESRRLASLQKRRELKTAGINIKITNRKQGQMDYNADIPFEKAPAPGFYDTAEEDTRNERQRERFDPRRQQLANKRKSEQDEQLQADEDQRKKRQKNDGPSAAFAAAQKAGQMQKIREAERSSKRRALNLPAPQVGEHELEDIIKMGMAGERATQSAKGAEASTRGLVSDYSAASMAGQTPTRTPRAPQEEDRVANEIRNARARTETQSALLGGENPDLHDDEAGTTGYGGVTPSKQNLATPNPLATPFRQAQINGTATPVTAGAAGATPLRTPRDTFRLNDQTPQTLPNQTPRELKLAQQEARSSLRAKLSSLPKPQDEDFELELPNETPESHILSQRQQQHQQQQEDAAIRDARERQLREARQAAQFARETQVHRRNLPLPSTVDIDTLLRRADASNDPIARESALLIARDAARRPGVSVLGAVPPIQHINDEAVRRAEMEISLELASARSAGPGEADRNAAFAEAWDAAHEPDTAEDNASLGDLRSRFDETMASLTTTAAAANALEKKLSTQHGGYMTRQKAMRSKIEAAGQALENETRELRLSRWAGSQESGVMAERLEALRGVVGVVAGRERRAQEGFRAAKELEG